MTGPEFTWACVGTVLGFVLAVVAFGALGMLP